MPETWNLPVITIRYQGNIDFDGYYHLIHNWLKARRYKVDDAVLLHFPGNEFGREEVHVWTANRKVDVYAKFEVTVNTHLWDIKEVEVIKDNEKKKIWNARVEVQLTGKIILDWKGSFERTPFLRKLRKFYHKFIAGIITLAAHYEDTAYYRLNNLADLIKAYFNMKASGFVYRRYLGDK